MVILKKFRCIGCAEIVNLDPFELCPNCETNKSREKSEMEKEYASPKDVSMGDYDWFSENQEKEVERFEEKKAPLSALQGSTSASV